MLKSRFFFLFTFLQGILLVSSLVAKPERYTTDNDSIYFAIEKFDREFYRSITTQKEYAYMEESEISNWGESIYRRIIDKWNKAWAWILQGREPTGFFSIIMQAAKYLSVLLLLLAIVWVIAKIDTYSEVSKKTFAQIENEEGELIARANFPSLISEAIDNKDFALAIRYHYLYALQLMVEKRVVNWDSQKTNSDYLREIEAPDIRECFREVTNWYQFIWFGKRSIDKDIFLKVKKLFEDFKVRL